MRRPVAGILAIAMLLAVLGASVALGAVRVGESGSESGDLVAISTTSAHVRAAAKPDRAKRRAGASDELSWPLRGAITGRFGEGRGGHSHAGIDIPKPAGTPIKAASAGRVIHADPEDGYGNYVCIAHVRLSTCYAHLEKVRTKEGASVRRGQVIGTVGNTGNSGALHLHFEVRRGKTLYAEPLNPAKYLPGA